MKYRHTEDEIDRVTGALGRLKDEQGIAAARGALPGGMRENVKRLMEIENIGFVRAVEILLRLEKKQWTN